MPPVRAVIVTRTAPLHSEFGLSYATKLFGEEAIASLPRYVRGPHRGEIKAWLVWEKAEKGGWSKYGVVRPGLVWARITATAFSEMPLYGAWMGRIEALSGHRDVLSEVYREQTLREREEAAAQFSGAPGCPGVRLLAPVLGLVS